MSEGVVRCMKILIVDDEKRIIEVLEAYFVKGRL